MSESGERVIAEARVLRMRSVRNSYAHIILMRDPFVAKPVRDQPECPATRKHEPTVLPTILGSGKRTAAAIAGLAGGVREAMAAHDGVQNRPSGLEKLSGCEWH